MASPRVEGDDGLVWWELGQCLAGKHPRSRVGKRVARDGRCCLGHSEERWVEAPRLECLAEHHKRADGYL